MADIPHSAAAWPGYEDDLRHFYDPTLRFADMPLGGLLDRVAGTRQPAYMESLGRLAGHEIILAESVHALIDEPALGDVLPIAHQRQEDIRGVLRMYAGNLALTAVDIAGEIKDNRVLRTRLMPDFPWATLPSDMVVAAKVLAATAHDGQTRRSGQPYYSHPDAAASILTVAWRRIMGYGRDDELDTHRFLLYLHDGYEDTIDPRAAYLSERPVIVSPLVAQRVLEHYGRPDPHTTARSLLYMTRTRDTDGNRMRYEHYTRRGITLGGREVIIDKPADIQHNLEIDPDKIEPGDEKAWKKLAKYEMYLEAKHDFLKAAEDYGDLDLAFLVHAIFSITPRDVKAAQADKFPFDIAAVAAHVRENFARRQGPDVFTKAV